MVYFWYILVSVGIKFYFGIFGIFQYFFMFVHEPWLNGGATLKQVHVRILSKYVTFYADVKLKDVVQKRTIAEMN